jgi:hypothetical protein
VNTGIQHRRSTFHEVAADNVDGLNQSASVDNLRGDPRFEELIRSVGFPEK